MHCIHGLQAVLNSIKSFSPLHAYVHASMVDSACGSLCGFEVNVKCGTMHLSQPHWLQGAE